MFSGSAAKFGLLRLVRPERSGSATGEQHSASCRAVASERRRVLENVVSVVGRVSSHGVPFGPRPVCMIWELTKLSMNRLTVAQVSKPAVSPISKSASRTTTNDSQVWKPAIRQTWKSALRVLILGAFVGRRHFYEPGHEFAEHGHEVVLGGHDFANVFVGHGHFI